jgi:ligand-binding sensor domain-containing protein
VEGEVCSNHLTHFTRHAGLLVAGSFDGGACYLQDGRWHALPTSSPYVHGLASDGERLWIAHSNGIARFDRAWTERAIGAAAGDPPALIEAAGRAATAALLAPDGSLLFASASGVLELRRDPRTSALRARHFGRKRGVPEAITALAADGERVYVASEHAGVVELRDGKVQRHLRDPDALPEAWVTALAARDGALWVATCQRGVARVSANDSQTLDRSSGLPGDRVIALAHADHGVVIGTLSGLARANADGSDARAWSLPLPDRRIAGLFAEGAALWIATESGMSEVR